MPYSRRPRYSLSPSPYKRYSRSISQSPSRSMSRDSSDAENPGNNLYVTGLSTRVSWRDLEKHFSSEGKVEDVRLVVDPWTQESRGFGFVTMSTVGDADRCVKYLDRSVLQGRVISVEKGSCVQQLFSKLTNQIEYNEQISDCYFEGCMPCISFFLQYNLAVILSLILIFRFMHFPFLYLLVIDQLGNRYQGVCIMVCVPVFVQARRRKGRTPTPGRYLGPRTVRARRRSTYSRSVSPCYSSERERGSSRSYSPCYNRRHHYCSPSNRRRSYSHHRRGRSYSRSRSPSYNRSPVRRQDHSYSPTYHRYYSPDECYYRRHHRSSPETPDDYKYRSRFRSRSRSISPVLRRYERSYSRSISPKRSRRSYSRSISPRRSRSYSRSISPRRSPSPKYYRRSYCRSVSHGDSRSSRSHSRSASADSTSQSE
ncbi:uncharacterized protein LOC142541134 isoform X2 [Primulina tabacum]|uniref:uncharacterized protein LOC142541134 isoform X2 n=2 Tax=Primulina tabacum TaxID=48773 RepID=UPI003F5A7D04